MIYLLHHRLRHQKQSHPLYSSVADQNINSSAVIVDPIKIRKKALPDACLFMSRCNHEYQSQHSDWISFLSPLMINYIIMMPFLITKKK
jgi:hypothetical protein